MSLSDPIADMLTRIRNAIHGHRTTVNIRASGVCEGVATVLKQEGYIDDYARIDDGTKQGCIRVYLRYGPAGEDVIQEIQKVSKPGRRVYRGVDELPRPLEPSQKCWSGLPVLSHPMPPRTAVVTRSGRRVNSFMVIMPPSE